MPSSLCVPNLQIIQFSMYPIDIGPFTHASKCPLLNLPLEIRSQIYKHALVLNASHRSQPARQQQPKPLSLLQTCRQIHDEACLVPFQVNDISVPAEWGSNTSSTSQLLGALEPWQLATVRGIEIQLMGAVLEAHAVANILCTLRASASDDHQGEKDGGSDKEVMMPPYRSGLRELRLIIMERQVLPPMADSAVGLAYCLDMATTPWLQKGLMHLPALRRFSLRIELSDASSVEAAERERVRTMLRNLLPCVTHLDVEFYVCGRLDIEDDWDAYAAPGEAVTSNVVVRPGFGAWMVP